MKKVFKWIGIVLGSLVGLILLVVAVLYLMGNVRLNKTYDFPPSNITIPTDAESIAYVSIGRSLCVKVAMVQI